MPAVVRVDVQFFICWISYFGKDLFVFQISNALNASIWSKKVLYNLLLIAVCRRPNSSGAARITSAHSDVSQQNV